MTADHAAIRLRVFENYFHAEDDPIRDIQDLLDDNTKLEKDLAEAALVCSGCEHPRHVHLADGCGAGGTIWGGECPCLASYSDSTSASTTEEASC